MKKFLPLALLFVAPSFFAQPVFFNNGCNQVTVTTGGILHINGDLWNDGLTGLIENNGTLTVINSTNPGDVHLENGSSMFGNGLYRVEHHWINNATFSGGTSTVELFGDTSLQYITSNNGIFTIFHNLTLTGSGTGEARKKILKEVDSYTDATGVLTINDRELNTDTNTFYVLNTSLTAVTNTTGTVGSEGFVSSDSLGSLSRETANNSGYLFPTGSSDSILRYRPVILTPQTNAPNTYTVRFVNSSTQDTLLVDSTICKVLPDFFHKINQTGGIDPASIDIFYYEPTDEKWEAIAQWNTPVTGLWNNLGTATASTGSPYNDVFKLNWVDFTTDSFVLARNVPPPPTITCIDSICPWTKGNIFNATGIGPIFSWTTSAGTTVVSGDSTSSVTVDWNDTAGFVSVFQIVENGCASSLSTCLVEIAIVPEAGFDTLSKGAFNNDWWFTDTSKSSVTVFWYFGDGDSTTFPNPQHNYAVPGTYTVTQVVTNAQGCIDSIFHVIEVKEGIIIPNVFTPNGDGLNDQFYIPNSGVKEFFIEIYDRWGLKIFEANDAEIRWDGRTLAGVMASDGTYYYVLKAIMHSDTVYSQPGFLMLLAGRTSSTTD